MSGRKMASAALVAAGEEEKGMLRGASTESRDLFLKTPKAIVYTDNLWKGEHLALGLGSYNWADLQPKHFDDRIKSIYLPFFYKAKMCENPDFRDCKTFKFSHSWVKVGDGVSSLKISKWW